MRAHADIVICENESDGKFGALLTCQENGSTKILRNEVAECPVVATRKLVHRLQLDTALLFTSKYTVGSQLRGQQGYTNKETGVFELIGGRTDQRIPGPDDDTQGLSGRHSDAPGGVPYPPRAERGFGGGGHKRARVDGREGCRDGGRGGGGGGLDYGNE